MYAKFATSVACLSFIDQVNRDLGYPDYVSGTLTYADLSSCEDVDGWYVCVKGIDMSSYGDIETVEDRAWKEPACSIRLRASYINILNDSGLRSYIDYVQSFENGISYYCYETYVDVYLSYIRIEDQSIVDSWVSGGLVEFWARDL